MVKDPFRYFRVEARELLDRMSKCALDIEGGAPLADGVAQLLRQTHTLKGAARVVRQREISELAHAVEDLLAPYRDGASTVPREAIDRLLRVLDAIEARLAELPAPPESAAAEGRVAVEPPRSLRTEVAEVDAVLDGLSAVHGELGTIRRAAGAVAPLRQLAARLVAELAAPRPAAARERLRDNAEDLHKALATLERELSGGTERAGRELRQAHEATERLRLVPAQAVFNALERTVRDVARGAGRRVEFVASGGDVRLDSDVLDVVQGALVQLVRNAVAHGIESEAERAAAHKPITGRVSLEVARRGQRVAFRCADDGRGVDLDAVRRVAARQGTVPAGALSAEQLLRVLLRGGVSTAGAVNEFAGRGIGLDVVREAVERLGGEIDVRTQRGQGSCFELLVPVSLVSIEALIVEAGGEVAAVPLESVRGTLRVAPADVVRDAQGPAITHDGHLIALLSLDALIGAAPPRRAPRAMSAFLIEGDPSAAVAVDRFVGIETLLLRPLPALAPARAIVAGVFIDDEGHARPVLDADALARHAYEPAAADVPAAATARPILVVDDSLTTRMLERSILESAGYEVQIATSGEEALEMARRTDYALMLVDVEMPGMDGFALVEHTRSDPALRGVPCVLVTSRDAPQDRQRGEAAGACAYIVKSEFDQAHFLDHVATLVAAGH